MMIQTGLQGMMKRKNFENNKYSIKILKSVQEVEETRNIWEEMQRHPNVDIDFYLTILEIRPEIIRPHVIMLFLNNHLKAMMVGRIEEVEHQIRIGYKTLFKPKVRSFTIVYGGLLGNYSYSVIKTFIAEIWSLLKNDEADIVQFSQVNISFDLYRLLTTNIGFLFRSHATAPNVHWKMTLPNNIDEFLGNMKRKHRYAYKTFEKAYPGKVMSKCFQGKEQIELICNELEKISQKSFQRGLGVGFEYNNEFRRRFTLWANKSALRVYVLYIENNPCAYWYGTIYGKTFFLNSGAYDPKYKNRSPGSYLFIKMIEDLCQNKNLKDLDFGFGDSFYKRRFGTQKWDEKNLFIYSPTIKSILLNIMRTTILLLSRLFEFTLERIRLKKKFKKIWRSLFYSKSLINQVNLNSTE